LDYSEWGSLRESLGEGTCELSTLSEGCVSVLNATRSPLLRYGVAVLATGLALLLQVVLIPWFEVEPDASPFMMFFAAVMAAAYVGGLGPGLLATVLSALASHYFFLYSQYVFRIDSFGQGLRLMIFVLEGALISLLVEAMRSARWRAREDRESLRRSEKRFRLLVEGARDYAILMLDPEGHIVSWNTGAERLLGYREAEIGGRHVSFLFTPGDVR
jgi:PAS domain-containing protein